MAADRKKIILYSDWLLLGIFDGKCVTCTPYMAPGRRNQCFMISLLLENVTNFEKQKKSTHFTLHLHVLSNKIVTCSI